MAGSIPGGLNFAMQILHFENTINRIIARSTNLPNPAQLLLQSGHEQIDFRPHPAIAGLWLSQVVQ
jgi:hypothetical protein